MTVPATLLTSGAQRLVELLNRYVDAQRLRQGRRIEFIRDFHAALMEVDRDYRRILGELENTLEDLAVEPDRAAARQAMRKATQKLRLEREHYDAARTSIRALVRNVMLVTDDPAMQSYFWAAMAYMLDEEPGIGFPANIPAAIRRLLERDIGALTRTPSSAVLKALEDGSTPDQVLAILRLRRAQMRTFLGHAVEQHAWLLARELR